jgi:hypothetical protein
MLIKNKIIAVGKIKIGNPMISLQKATHRQGVSALCALFSALGRSEIPFAQAISNIVKLQLEKGILLPEIKEVLNKYPSIKERVAAALAKFKDLSSTVADSFGSTSPTSDNDYTCQSEWSDTWAPEDLEIITEITKILNPLKVKPDYEAIARSSIIKDLSVSWSDEITMLTQDGQNTEINPSVLAEYQDPSESVLDWDDISDEDKRVAFTCWSFCNRKWELFLGQFGDYPQLFRIIRALQDKITNDVKTAISKGFSVLSETSAIIIKDKFFYDLFGSMPSILFDTNFYSAHLNFLEDFSLFSEKTRGQLRKDEELNALTVMARTYYEESPSFNIDQEACITDYCGRCKQDGILPTSKDNNAELKRKAKRLYVEKISKRESELIGQIPSLFRSYIMDAIYEGKDSFFNKFIDTSLLLKLKGYQRPRILAWRRLISKLEFIEGYDLREEALLRKNPKRNRIALESCHDMKVQAWQRMLEYEAHINLRIASLKREEKNKTKQDHELRDQARVLLYEETLATYVEPKYQEFIAKRVDLKEKINKSFSHCSEELRKKLLHKINTFQQRDTEILGLALYSSFTRHIAKPNGVALDYREVAALKISMRNIETIREIIETQDELSVLATSIFKYTNRALHYANEAFVTRSTIMAVPIERQQPERAVKYPDLAYSSTAYISSIELLAQTRVYLFKHGENPVKAFKQGYRAIAKAYESLVAHRQKIDPKLELLYRATSQLEAIRNPSSPEKRIRDIAGKSYLKDLSPKERKDRALRIVVLISDVLNGKKVRSDLLSKSLSDYEIPQRPEELSATLYRQMLSLSKDINSSFSGCPEAVVA